MILLPMCVLGIAASGGLLAAGGLEPIYDSPLLLERMGLEQRTLAVALGASTTALLAATLLIAIASEPRVEVRALVVGGVLGTLNPLATLVLAVLIEGGDARAITVSVAVLCGLVGLPLGLLVGAMMPPVVRTLRRAIYRPTLSDAAALLQMSGVIAMAVGVLVWVGASVRGRSEIGLQLPAALFIPGLVALAVGRGLRARLAWLVDQRCVRVSLASLGIEPDSCLPLDSRVSASAQHALVVRVRSADEGVYRAGDVRLPVALVN